LKAKTIFPPPRPPSSSLSSWFSLPIRSIRQHTHASIRQHTYTYTSAYVSRLGPLHLSLSSWFSLPSPSCFHVCSFVLVLVKQVN
jgi:hypothetical protein